MAKLITFGCSFTVGVGLPDVYPRNDTPSSMGWPALLGEKLGLEVENRGIPRGGNLEIFNNMLKADIQPNDVCVVLWSSCQVGNPHSLPSGHMGGSVHVTNPLRGPRSMGFDVSLQCRFGR